MTKAILLLACVVSISLHASQATRTFQVTFTPEQIQTICKCTPTEVFGGTRETYKITLNELVNITATRQISGPRAGFILVSQNTVGHNPVTGGVRFSQQTLDDRYFYALETLYKKFHDDDMIPCTWHEDPETLSNEKTIQKSKA